MFVRNWVLKRDKNICLCCGAKKNLTIDHILPKSKGGGNKMSNLQILCKICNEIKADSTINFRAKEYTGGRLPTMSQVSILNRLGVLQGKDGVYVTRKEAVTTNV